MQKNLVKVAIYIRVANKETIKDEFENQKNAIDEYLKRNYGRVIGEYFVDNGYSGISLNRPGFNLLRSKLRNDEFDFVVSYDSNKISRNAFELIVDFKKKYNIDFIFVKENFDTSKENLFLQNFFKDNYNLNNRR